MFGDKYKLGWLELRNAAVDLEWSRDGRSNTWTFGDPDRKGEPLNLPLIRRALLAGTTLRYRDPRMQIDAALGFATVKARDQRHRKGVGEGKRVSERGDFGGRGKVTNKK